MPFTPAHVAAVLPLRRVGGRALPLAALAAGSMAPDLPFFVPPLSFLNAWTHTPLGVVTVDVGLGLAMWATWRSANPALHDLSPASLRERWTPAGWTTHPSWLVVGSVAVGAATHVLWDAFTHPGRFGATHLPFLAASYPGPLGPVPGYQYAQYLSSVVGLAILAWVGWCAPRTPMPSADRPRAWVTLAWLSAAAGVLGAAGRVWTSGALDNGLHAVVFAVLTGGMGAAAAVVLVACWLQGWRRTPQADAG